MINFREFLKEKTQAYKVKFEIERKEYDHDILRIWLDSSCSYSPKPRSAVILRAMYPKSVGCQYHCLLTGAELLERDDYEPRIYIEDILQDMFLSSTSEKSIYEINDDLDITFRFYADAPKGYFYINRKEVDATLAMTNKSETICLDEDHEEIWWELLLGLGGPNNDIETVWDDIHKYNILD